MDEILTSPVFRYCFFPLMSAAAGIAIRYVSRNDQFAKFKKEDLAVGLQLALSACLMLVVLRTDDALVLRKQTKALADILKTTPLDQTAAIAVQHEVQTCSERLTTSSWTITGMLFGLFAISTVVRKRGWRSETEMTPMFGITVPLMFGVLALIVVMAGATK